MRSCRTVWQHCQNDITGLPLLSLIMEKCQSLLFKQLGNGAKFDFKKFKSDAERFNVSSLFLSENYLLLCRITLFFYNLFSSQFISIFCTAETLFFAVVPCTNCHAFIFNCVNIVPLQLGSRKRLSKSEALSSVESPSKKKSNV